MLDVVPTILHVLRRKSNKELVDLQQALPRRNLTAGKVGGGTFTKHHGVQLDRERDWEQWLAGSAPHHVPRGVCCGTRKCGLYMDNGGGGARCSSEARLALSPVRQTCRWSTHSLNRFLPCVTTTPTSHEVLSIPVLLLRTVLVVGASRSALQYRISAIWDFSNYYYACPTRPFGKTRLWWNSLSLCQLLRRYCRNSSNSNVYRETLPRTPARTLSIYCQANTCVV